VRVRHFKEIYCLLLRLSVLWVVFVSVDSTSGQVTFTVPHEVQYTIGDDVGSGGEYAFAQIRFLLSDGVYFYVIDGKSPSVRFYELVSGQYSGSFGRQGDGPGEFQDIYSGYGHNDGRLWLFDRSLQKVEIYRQGVHVETLRFSDDEFMAPQVFRLESDSLVVAHSTLNSEGAVECIDLRTRRKVCSWLDLRPVFSPEMYPLENDRTLADWIRIAHVDRRKAYFVRDLYDGTVWKARLEGDTETVTSLYSSEYAKGAGYFASGGRVYKAINYNDYYGRDGGVRKRYPYHYSIYSVFSGGQRIPRMYHMFSSTLNMWMDPFAEKIRIAYVLHREDRGSDMFVDTVSIGADSVRTVQVAAWTIGPNTVRDLLQIGENEFLVGRIQDGIPVISRMTLDLGE